MSLNIKSIAEVGVISDPYSVDLILEDQLYLGNISAAESVELRAKLGLTHILSVCPDYPSTGPKHLAILVDDTEREDILIHLPTACQFIQDSLDQGGKVLVHCVMGISRSATVVSAYCHPYIRPNYSFIQQLKAFEACKYTPSPTNPAYLEWKTKREHNSSSSRKNLGSIPVIPDHLFLRLNFPDDQDDATLLITNLGITHILYIFPDKFSSRPAFVGGEKHHHIMVPNNSREGMLVALPAICKFIGEVLDGDNDSGNGGASRALVMTSRKLPPGEAFPFMKDVLPLFSPIVNFSRHLELFNAYGYEPTAEHPLVEAWIAEPDGSDQAAVSRADYLTGLTTCKTLSPELREFLRAR